MKRIHEMTRAVEAVSGRAGALLVLAAAAGSPAHAQSVDQLRDMSIDDLAQVNVSSVSKSDQPLSEAPAAIYVISHEDIIRSGAATIPEMLRLAPNLQVYETGPGQWVVTARGLNGSLQAQNFSNKLLVLVDGRTVYTPLFSGVYWDLPDVLPDSIDRIEVISGPGATLWGANAVNGVINVITRPSSELKGAYANVRAGPDRQAIGVRLAGSAGSNITYSLHARYLHERAFDTAAGGSAEDPWHRFGGGFRADWTPNDADTVTLEGEAFGGRASESGDRQEPFSGRNLTLRWNRTTAGGGEWQAQAFYDRIARNELSSGGARFHTDTFDAELQHSFTLGARHQIVAGAGARLVRYDIAGSNTLYFDPGKDELFIADAFVQDRFALTPKLTLTAGLKVEKLPYTGASLLPEARIAWKPSAKALVWASVSRAVRSPTPFDTDVQERVSVIAISGNADFLTEKLTAYEAGLRLQPSSKLSGSITGFYHRYDDLRTIELLPAGPAPISLTWGNKLRGSIYGVEAWGEWRAAPWWTLSAGATVLGRDFTFAPGAFGILGTSQLGNDPPYVLKLHSAMNPVRDVTFDLDLRAYGALREAAVPAYRELSGRLAWQVAPQVALSLTGTNLLHDRHQEYPGSDFIPRRVMGGVELRF
ncbi:MAG: TonB-dependent receptor plug domain-containing protein [Tsuneonella sp.]